MSKKKKSTIDDELVKKQAEELFSDVISFTKEKKVKKNKQENSTVEVSVEEDSSVKNDKTITWLENQVKGLSDRVEELEQLLAQKNAEIQALRGRSNAQQDSDLTRGIRLIFNELRDNYEGNNPTKTRYSNANIRVLLEKFLKTFPFLMKK